MSNENMNNNEETSALFVSAQKKKQAEEEARKKAAQEQAKIEAAEAEVRRMEQEVEERKRQAKEQAQAAAEAERAAAAKAAAAKTVKEKSGGKSKLPIFIGIGVAVVALIAVIAVVVGGGSSPKIDYDNLECYGEYKPTTKGYDFTLYYPDSIYPVVKEEFSNEIDTVDFTVEQPTKNNPIISVFMRDTNASEEEVSVNAKDINETLIDFTKENLGSYEISEESSTNFSSGEPDYYVYTCAFKEGEELLGRAISWLSKNSEGHVVLVMAMTYQVGNEEDNTAKVLDLFKEKNMQSALKIPGYNEPTDYDWEGKIELSELGAYIPVPKDRFVSVDGVVDSGSLYVDKNGAMIFSSVADIGSRDLVPLGEENKEINFATYRSISDEIDYGSYFNSNNRMYINDTKDAVIGLDYFVEYRIDINDITYWERDYYNYWLKGDEVYMQMFTTFVPEKNKEVYKVIFDTALKDTAVSG